MGTCQFYPSWTPVLPHHGHPYNPAFTVPPVTNEPLTTGPEPAFRELIAPSGWICPRCGKVWAPWVAFCDCKPPDVSEATT